MATTDKDKRYLGHIVKVVSDILSDQTMVLQRIERAFYEQTKVYKELNKRIDLMNKKIEGGFDVLENQRITSLDKTISQRFAVMDYGYLKQLKQEIDGVHEKVQQQIQAQLLKLLMKKTYQVAKPTAAPQIVAPAVAQRISIPAQSRSILASRMPSIPASPLAESEETVKAEIPASAGEDDWMESELEGAQIFDTIITGWKKRDWEKAKGTKEEFMRAWKKLSSSDRQKVKMGAWSKPIIDKMKMLGREL